jgi:DNA-binding transcriptional LysR family regulator
MTLQQLKYVRTVADKGTISEAAKALFLSQPSLTAAIHELETELGVTIFHRTNKGIILTSDGEEFLGYARQVLEQTALMEEKYAGKAPGKHRFCVSTQHYSFAVEAFEPFQRDHPPQSAAGKRFDLSHPVYRQAPCVRRVVEPAGPERGRHIGGFGPLSPAVLRTRGTQLLLFFRGDFEYPGVQKGHPHLRPGHPV